jgi:hypothetical protein
VGSRRERSVAGPEPGKEGVEDFLEKKSFFVNPS